MANLNSNKYIMKKNMTFLAILFSSLAVMASCNAVDEDYIPGPIMPPETETPGNGGNNGTDTPIEHPEEGEMYNSYQGLVMCGYQGWFACPGDGSDYGPSWAHYSDKWQFPRIFEPGVGRCGIDFWPDVSEYEITYETPRGFELPDGSRPRVISSYDESTVNVHFRWMKEYGISGVFMQRFGSQINNKTAKQLSDKVLESAMKASNEHGRAICMMYDLVGLGSECSVDLMIEDIRAVTQKYNFFDREAGQRYYLYHEGKPLIAFVSVDENANYTIADAQRLVDTCQEMGFSIMISCPTYWREGGGDVPFSTVGLHALIKDSDILTPWYVGRYDHDGTAGAHGGKFSNFKNAVVKKDKEWLDRNGVEFAPLCFPGYSDLMMHPNNKEHKRAGGDFFWSQVYNSVAIGCKMIYVAMFDEIDEGTAIFKCLRKCEVPSSEFHSEYYVVFENGAYRRSTTPVTVSGNGWCKKASELNIKYNGIEDHLQNDHYLWLAGQAGKMLRGEIPLTEKQPARQ